MEVGIRILTAFVWRVYCKICDHAPADKLLGDETPCQFDVLIHGGLILECNVEAVRQLCLGVLLHLLHRIPECFPVFVLR